MNTINTDKFSNIFNNDFYPTPNEVLDAMQIDCNGLRVLEPSAGKGNIIDYLKANGASHVSFCEINKDLATICMSKAQFLTHNFFDLKAEDVSHIQLIVMNPPFTHSYRHIIHAWDIAPDGCQIISLCNTDTISSWRRNDETSLAYILKHYGNEIDLGSCFENAERKTNVQVTCIHLFKPLDNNSTNFEGFYMDVDEATDTSDEGLIKYDTIQSLVNSYMAALKCFDEFSSIKNKMDSATSALGIDRSFSFSLSYNSSTTNKREFAIFLQKEAWQLVFKKLNITKYLTSGAIRDINNFCETQQNIPFTRRNIYKMLEIIIGTRDQIFSRALVEAVDAFTKHTHENRYHLEGWKTNSGHLLNQKFIIPYVFKEGSWVYKGLIQPYYSNNLSGLNDLIKVLCNLTGTEFSSKSKDDDTDSSNLSMQSFFNRFKGHIEPNRWYETAFFEIKGYKKGTMHIKFKNLDHWAILNRAYAKIKGQVLPEKL